MEVYTINPSNLIRYHNAIIYGNSENQIKEFFKEAIGSGNSDGIPVKQVATIVDTYKDDMEERYTIFQKAKVRTIDEYNKKNPKNKLEHVVLYIYGESREFAKCIKLLGCLQKSWAVGYHFAIGVTDGKNLRFVRDFTANCEYVADLTHCKAASKVSDCKNIRNIVVYGEKYSNGFVRSLLETTTNSVIVSYPKDKEFIIPSIEKTMYERFKTMYLLGYDDIYEYDEEHPGDMEPITVFVKHCNDDTICDGEMVRRAYQGYNAGIYFVFCFDETPIYQNNDFEATSYKIFRFDDKLSTQKIERKDIRTAIVRDKYESHKYIEKCNLGRLFLPEYLSVDIFDCTYEEKTPGYFYKVDKNKKEIVDIFND